MKYIETFTDGMNVRDVYLVKSKISAVTKNGKEYLSLTLQDKTGQIDAKIWSPGSPSIRDFDVMDFVEIDGRVTVFNNANQLNINQIGRAPKHTFDPSDYFPVTGKDIPSMQKKAAELAASVREEHLRLLIESFFGDPAFMEAFSKHSAAKSVHHGFVGGLLEHSLSVAEICDMISAHYGPKVNRDLLVTAALLHDVGKLREISDFPTNDYTDEGQLLGHIVIGASMIMDAADRIEGFPKRMRNELVHLILSHHGELEFGSPKKPALIEAIILSHADNMDAKVETMYEVLSSKAPVTSDGWIGYMKLLDSNIRRTDGSCYES